MNLTPSFSAPLPANPTTSSFNYNIPFQRQFVSAQRRYDNVRARESESQQRLCRECGRIIQGDDLNYQHHVISHEAAFLCYQIYHFEKGNTLPDNYYGQSRAKYTKNKKTTDHSPPKKSYTNSKSNVKSARDLVRKQLGQPVPKKRKAETPSAARGRPKKQPKLEVLKEARFINDRPLKSELKLSEDESEASNLTESDLDEVELPVDDADAVEQDPEDADYMPAAGISSHGRALKPKSSVD